MRFAAPGVPVRMWTVSGTGRNDAPVDHPCSQQFPCVPPEFQKFSPRQAVSGAKRVQTRTKQKFRTIDISDSAEDRLVHQQSPDRSTTCQNAIDRCCNVGIFPQWIRPNARDQFFPLCPRQHFASRWSTKLQPVLAGREALGGARLEARGKATRPFGTSRTGQGECAAGGRVRNRRTGASRKLQWIGASFCSVPRPRLRTCHWALPL